MKAQQLDRELAPEGYFAKLGTNDSEVHPCEGCALDDEEFCGSDRKCAPRERPDGQQVIFVKKRTHETDK